MHDPDQPRLGSRGWTVSGSFLAMVAALLGLAVLMVARPDLARWAVFPFVLTGWLISLCLHEFGHAVAAYAGGDHSVRDKGYLTLDPLRYTDVQFSIVWPLVFLALGGIGLPGGAVYVNARALSPPQRTLVSAAGPLATLAVLILLLAILRGAASALAATPALLAALAFLAFLQLTALVLNLLPIPGLDGWGIVAPWLPRPLQHIGARAAGIAIALLFVMFVLGPAVNEMFWRLVFNLCAMVGLDAREAIRGLRLFQFWRHGP
jgi:Zn-dependent protease